MVRSFRLRQESLRLSWVWMRRMQFWGALIISAGLQLLAIEIAVTWGRSTPAGKERPAGDPVCPRL
jgi:hypothetical protein